MRCTRAISVAMLVAAPIGCALAPNASAEYTATEAPSVTGGFSLHWAPAGDRANQVRIEHPLVDTQKVILCYEQFFGLYPKRWEGRWLNGGVPQNVNLNDHLSKLRTDIDRLIPDENFSGYAVIDYEAWDLRWDYLKPEYQSLSRELVRAANPYLSPALVEARAEEQFTAAATNFLRRTIQVAKEERPHAKWGFYAWPHNDINAATPGFEWVWEESDVLFPSIYARHVSVEDTPDAYREIEPWRYVQRIERYMNYCREACPGKPVLFFVWRLYNFTDTPMGQQNVNDIDLRTMMQTPLEIGADGIVIWDQIRTEQQRRDAEQFINQRMMGEILHLQNMLEHRQEQEQTDAGGRDGAAVDGGLSFSGGDGSRKGGQDGQSGDDGGAQSSDDGERNADGEPQPVTAAPPAAETQRSGHSRNRLPSSMVGGRVVKDFQPSERSERPRGVRPSSEPNRYRRSSNDGG
ncbi:MAG: hypothetical protein VYC34_06000 [Planctomycetota bacterium]|nr:hypothetical protein [Planctomycetota bacterium]